ncbi:hypothetical protein [Xanthocytophaga agilis]|uniref:Uncharacterized protein n=1 Tax=Xanthocytophaga agilis TaxID=3048010 RepID=A0AAE3QYL9_9BACT|nr:hypothetical protein [Xanthocytophaga agilis]MDJ1500501.1 hypothetical protein [Xanthocytophaga agilis]
MKKWILIVVAGLVILGIIGNFLPKTKEQSDLANLKDYLNDHNTNLCAFSKELDEKALEINHEADEKYGEIPQGQDKSYEKVKFSEKRQLEEFPKLCKKYGMPDSISSIVTIYALKECK